MPLTNIYNIMNTKHNNTIDFMRAVLIVLMILIHIVNFGTLYPGIKDGILTFLMPSFLVITGYLVNVDKPLCKFGTYLMRIALPYVIMVTGFALLSLYLPVRGGIDHFDIPTLCHTLFVTSIGPYWFLHAMIVCGTLYYATFRLTANTCIGIVSRLALLATVMIVVSQYTPFLSLRNAAYYFIGVVIRVSLGNFDSVYRKSLLALVPFALLISQRDLHDWGTLSVLACVMCFFCFCASIEQLSPACLRHTMHYIGRNTLPIYIFHPIFTMLAKYILPIFAFDPTGLTHAAVTIILCLVGSIGIGWFMDRTGLSYIFGKRNIIR